MAASGDLWFRSQPADHRRLKLKALGSIGKVRRKDLYQGGGFPGMLLTLL